MLLHFQRYASALAIVLVAFVAYALLVVPLLEPSLALRASSTTSASDSSATAGAMQRHRRKVEHLFPAGSWQLKNPKVLETEHGTLVFKDYRPLPDGRMELKPLTLIVHSQQAADDKKRPLILDAPEGAILQFDSTTDPTRADFGKLLGGLLSGPIRIYSPATSHTANDEMNITTRNVQLDERRIWTPHAVNFRYGASHGSGRDLVVTLVPAENQAKRKSGPAIDGVKSVELVHVDKFHFETAGDVMLPGQPKKPAKPGENKPPPAPVEVTCRGPFMYDFEEQVATFEDAVDVIRLNRDGPSDQLNCQLLSIYFRERDDKPAPKDDKNSTNMALEVDRVVAVGHPVVLRAPSMGATARGQRLEYHFVARRIVLDDNDRVMLMDEKFDIEARQLEYELAESGGLGRLWAAGPGRLRVRKPSSPTKTPLASGRMRPPVVPIAARSDPNAPLMFEATWQKELRLRPHQHQHVVSLMENAGVKVAAMGGFTAQEIHLWLNETPRAANAVPRASTGKPEFGSGKFDVQPDRMLALGQVKIAAEQLDGDTGRLEVWFRNPAPVLNAATPSAATPVATNPAAVTNPLLPKPTPAGQAAATNAPPPAQKFRLTGDVVRLQLLRQGEATNLDEVSVDGHVRLVEEPLVTAAVPVVPLVITGQALQMQGGLGESSLVRVLGEPAEVAARGTTMRGQNIQLHRGENRAWIEGPGQMLLPMERDLQGGKLARPTNISVTWQQGLDFDGSLAHFTGNVEARSEQKQWARADELEVTLTQRIDFLKAKGQPQPQVAVVEFNGHFALENSTFDKQGKLASIEKMQAQSLRIEQQSGDITSTGPGWVSSVRLGGSASPLSARGLAPAAPVQPQDGKPQFNYLFVEFQLQLVGNIYQRQMEFQRHVRSVYGPVSGWEGTLDIDRPELLGEQGILMSCQRLALRQMPGMTPDSTTMEMDATGDTVVEGKGFTARAARISYADEKQLVILEGDGRRDAELTRQTTIGGPQSSLAAKRIMYWRFDNRVDVSDVRELEFNPTAGEFKSPPREQR